MEVMFLSGAWGDTRIDRARACQLLQCDEEGLDRQIANGLPQWQELGGLKLGYCDVMNAGLYSGSGRSVAELAERYLVRFGEQPREQWVEERHWLLTLTGSCPRGCERERAPSLPEEGARVALTREWRLEEVMGGSRGWTLGVALSGVRSRVLSPRLRSLYMRTFDELHSGALCYQYLPHDLRHDPEAAQQRGVADCLTTALTLQRACGELGIPSRVRLGYILGIVPIEHAWLEALDGETYKPLDPVLAALLARSGSRAGNVGSIADFYLGSLPNCLLPWPVGSSSPLHGPVCPHQGATSGLTARAAQPPARDLQTSKSITGVRA